MSSPLSLLLLVRTSLGQPGLSACVPGGGKDHFPFCNVSLPVDERVRDLVGRIDDKLKPNLLTARFSHGGSKLGPSADGQPLTELGVPAYYWGSNCIHSSMFSNCTDAGACSTSFPSGPSWAATFSKRTMREMAAVVGAETRAGFNMGSWLDNGRNGAGLECWGPVVNINRDPRWGRNSEGGAEDPYLMQQLGVAWTRGLQESAADPRYVQVAVTLKHFDGNSLEDADGFTRHTADARISKYALAEYYWPAFKGAIRDAGAKGVMCSYNAVNGVPTCVDPLMKAARDAWNFSGYVTSDSDSVADVWNQHHYVPTAAQASCLAVRDGGCDIDSGNTYASSLLQGVSEGHCAMADVDAALFNTMKVRFELGLFDPIADQPLWKLGAEDIGTDAAAALNLRAAQESLVLVQNPSPGGKGAAAVLPIRAGQKLAVLGPHGNATRQLIQVDTGRICASGELDCFPSTLAELARLNGLAGGTTTFVQGVDVIDNSTAGIAAAVAAAKAADFVVLGLGIGNCGGWWGNEGDHGCGERTGAAGAFLEGETHDRTSVDLPPQQHALAAAVLALGKPTAIYLLNGGSVALEPELRHAANPPAVVEAFYPGAAGATALAQSLFGAANRWGRMPYTVYHAGWARNNSMLEMEVATSRRTYRYGADALVRFGTGLSLSSFGLGFANNGEGGGGAVGAVGAGDAAGTAAAATLRTDGSSADLVVALTVTNRGPLVGDAVVMAYFHPMDVPLPLHPVVSLFNFTRLSDLAVGAAASASFAINTRALLLATADGDLVSAPGAYKLTFEDGAGAVLTVPLQLTGEQVTVEPFPQPPRKK
jgi:beta-glucosidase-like glycosyl hydrolase